MTLRSSAVLGAIFQRFGSRANIIGTGCLLALVATAIAAGLAADLYRQAVAARRQELSQFATLVAEVAERSLQAIDLAQADVLQELRQRRLSTVAELMEYATSASFHAQLQRRFAALPQADSLLIADANGQLLNDSQAWPVPLINIAGQPYFRNARADPGQDGVLSQVLPNHTNGATTVFVVRRITAPNGDFLGVVLGSARLSYFEALYRAVQAGDDTSISLALRDGTLVVRYPAAPSLIGRQFTDLAMPSNTAVQNVEGPSPIDGKWRVVSMRALTHYPATVAVSIERAAMLAPWRTEAILLALAAASLDLALAGGVALMLRQMRVQRQAADAVRVEADNESQREREIAALDTQAAADRAGILSSLATEFERQVGDISRAVAVQAGQVQSSAIALARFATDTTARTRNAAAEAAASAADVNTISAQTEALSESIEAVSRQASQGAAVVTAAAAAARDADATMATLTRSASHIGQIVNMISGFAQKTNLLALNATIEAARGGDAGRGFAVVAAEVKILSKAVSEATEDIKRQIGGIQAATLRTAAAMQKIRHFVTTIEDIASHITLTMEHHRTATRIIADSIIHTAGGAHLLSDHIGDANCAAIETGVTAADMQIVASNLADQADALRTASDAFLAQVATG
jgi:methyl-accepting chemotaxis protein